VTVVVNLNKGARRGRLPRQKKVPKKIKLKVKLARADRVSYTAYWQTQKSGEDGGVVDNVLHSSNKPELITRAPQAQMMGKGPARQHSSRNSRKS